MNSYTDWKKALLNFNASIKEAIQVLNSSALKIVLVVDSKGILLGAITDGDIRTALLLGKSIHSPLTDVLNRNPITVLQGTPKHEVKRIMLLKRVQSIPIVDERNMLMGLHSWKENEGQRLSTKLMVIMAGGKGTRLLPRTKYTPKPMLKVAGKPILEHIIERAKMNGISRFAISVHHLGDVIEDYFGNGEEFGVEIDYLRELMPLDTAGSLGLLQGIPEDPVLVTNGDVLTTVNYSDVMDFHVSNQASATIAIQKYDLQVPFGVVKTEGMRIIDYVEKPVIESSINAGVYALSPRALELVPQGVPFSMPELFLRVIQSGLKALAFPIHESWMDLGTHVDFESAKKSLEEKDNHPD